MCRCSWPSCYPASSCGAAGGSRRCCPSTFCPGRSRPFPRSSRSTGCSSGKKGSSTAFCGRCSVFGVRSGSRIPGWPSDRTSSPTSASACLSRPSRTLPVLAGRVAIPQELYDAASVDGAGACRRLLYVIFPILGNLYLVCTLLFTLWTVGDFTTVALVSEGAPFYSTDVLATLGIHYAFDAAQPSLGVAAVMSALPMLLPIPISLLLAF